MSQENVEVAWRLWERFSRGAALGRAGVGISDVGWHPDVAYVEDPRWPGSGVYRGLEAIQARFEEYLEIFGAIEVTLHEVVDLRDVVVIVFGSRGESIQTGLPFEHEWAYVWTFRDGRVVEWRAYFEKDEVLEAVGLRE